MASSITPQTIGVAIRCFNRIDDAVINVREFFSRFSAFEFYIVVVTNGDDQGHVYPLGQGEDYVLRLDPRTNTGLTDGDAAMFRASLEHLQSRGIQNAVLLTSDVWLLDESLLKKYLPRLLSGQRQWISGQWNVRYEVAVDLVMANVDFVLKNKLVWPTNVFPEKWIHDRLMALGPACYERIREIFPIMFPRGLWRGGFDPYGDLHNTERINYFPRARMVGHHIECLPERIISKKRYANECAGFAVFPELDLDASQRRDAGWRRFYRALYHAIDDVVWPLTSRMV